MILALGQIPDGSRPLDSFPDYSLVGNITTDISIVRQGGSLGIQATRKTIKRTIKEPKRSSRARKVDKEIDVSIIERKPQDRDLISDEEDILAVIEAFCLIVDD